MDEINRGACGQDGCRETRYYLENGLWFCRQGHQQEGRQVIADDEDFGTQGRTIRQKKEATQRVSKKYYGSQAYQLFLEAYQLVLWKQCYAFIHEKGLPTELEDLWTLRLQRLYKRGDDSYPSGDNTSEIFSSQTEQTELDDEEYIYHRRKLSDSPKAIDSVALCYIAALFLRIPISLGYVQRWIARDDVPLLKLTRYIPPDMKERLPALYYNVLDPRNIPTGDQLHRAVADLTVLYFREFGVTVPPINSPILLLSYIKQLALPLEVYVATNRLREIVDFSFSFTTKPGRFNKLLLPEVQLMSLVVVATKLLYPFDDKKRYPNSLKDPAAQLVDWDLWSEVREDFNTRGKFGQRIGKGFEIDVNEKDALHMTHVQLDDYMDWYSKMWIDTKKGANPFADMFPTERVDNTTLPSPDSDDDSLISTNLHKIMSKMKMRRVLSDDDTSKVSETIARPGSTYNRYRYEEQLSKIARDFYNAAATVIGVSLGTIVFAVYQAECRINGQDRTKSKRRDKSRSRSQGDSKPKYSQDIGQ